MDRKICGANKTEDTQYRTTSYHILLTNLKCYSSMSNKKTEWQMISKKKKNRLISGSVSEQMLRYHKSIL